MLLRQYLAMLGCTCHVCLQFLRRLRVLTARSAPQQETLALLALPGRPTNGQCTPSAYVHQLTPPLPPPNTPDLAREPVSRPAHRHPPSAAPNNH